MNPECRELELLRSAAAADAATPAEAARVAAHLAGCPGCREADRAERELLGLVRLPAPSPAETRLLADLPARALRELRVRDRRRTWARRVGAFAGIAAAVAAVALMLLAPAMVRRPLPPEARPAATEVAWQEPDPEALWAEASALDWDGGTATDSLSDAALAAYDAGAGE